MAKLSKQIPPMAIQAGETYRFLAGIDSCFHRQRLLASGIITMTAILCE